MAKNFNKILSIRFVGPVEVRSGLVWLNNKTLDGIISDTMDNVEGLAELTLCITPVKDAGLTITTENLEAEEEDHEAV